MTKEYFLKHILMLCDLQETKHYDEFNRLADEFFSQNVIIPKGANPHPYADVLHEWIEGAAMQSYIGETVVDYGMTAIQAFPQKYHIKQQEPVYEWQYLAIRYGNKNRLTDYMIDGELEGEYGTTYYKLEETKRIRQ